MNPFSTIALICIFAIYFDLFFTGEATKGSKKLVGKPHGNGHSLIKSAHSPQGGIIKKVKPTKIKGNQNHRDNKHQMKLNNAKAKHSASNRKNKAGSVNKHASEKVIRKGKELTVKNEKSQRQSLKKDNNKPADSALGKLDKNKKKKHSVVTAKSDNLNSQLELCHKKCCKTADGLLVQKEGNCQNQKQSTVVIRRKRAWVECNSCWDNYNDTEWNMCPRCFPNAAQNLLGDVTSERNPAESSYGNTRIYNVPGSTLFLPRGTQSESDSEDSVDDDDDEDEEESDSGSEIEGENNGNGENNDNTDDDNDNNVYVDSSTDNEDEDNTDDEDDD